MSFIINNFFCVVENQNKFRLRSKVTIFWQSRTCRRLKISECFENSCFSVLNFFSSKTLLYIKSLTEHNKPLACCSEADELFEAVALSRMLPSSCASNIEAADKEAEVADEQRC